MTELASVLSILVGVLAIGVALATVTLTALHRMERRMDQRLFSQLETYNNQRFDQIDQRMGHLAERVAKLEAGQARFEGQPYIIREAMFDRVPAPVRE